MRGVTDTAYRGFRRVLISTRTPHAGSDAFAEIVRRVAVISTRTPHAGSDHAQQPHLRRSFRFQPALPMRGVTKAPAMRGSTR